MRNYELTVVFHPDLEMNIDPALEKVKKIVEGSGGQIIRSEVDGKKRMAYTIKKQDFAVYYFFVVSLPPEAPNKISSTLNIMDEVLRYELVKEDPRREKYATRRAERAARQQAVEGDEAKEEATEAKDVAENGAEAKAEATDEKVGEDKSNKE